MKTPTLFAALAVFTSLLGGGAAAITIDVGGSGGPLIAAGDSWHYFHMLDPQSMSEGSIMPAYPWLFEDELDTSTTAAKIEAMQTLGVPYPEGYAAQANADLMEQAEAITANLAKSEVQTVSNLEIIALIAYLQRLGTDIKATPETAQVPEAPTSNE